ncbi:MAG: hypothetical protein ABR928_15270, partial [Terracidiphilus sp.]
TRKRRESTFGRRQTSRRLATCNNGEPLNYRDLRFHRGSAGDRSATMDAWTVIPPAHLGLRHSSPTNTTWKTG